jgi:hypothetical protein
VQAAKRTLTHSSSCSFSDQKGPPKLKSQPHWSHWPDTVGALAGMKRGFGWPSRCDMRAMGCRWKLSHPVHWYMYVSFVALHLHSCDICAPFRAPK